MLIRVENQVQRTVRVQQLEGLFDLGIQEKTSREWDIEIDLNRKPWAVGLIVGQSGSGKSTIARHLFGERLDPVYDWPADQSVVDGFPEGMRIKEITELLSSVGFSSPPSWLVPFRCLSNGQQFRANMARLMAETPAGEIAVCDEFSSVVDRTVAKVASVAISKTIRRRGQKFVAISCHSDVVEWLDPDWVFNVDTGELIWRCERLRHPAVELRFYRVHTSVWGLFRHHHYLSGHLAAIAWSFVAECRIADQWRVAAFSSALSYHGKSGACYREHRTVCLPDFQGLGIGNTLSNWVARVMTGSTGRKYRSTTSHPAMIYHRAKSPLWSMIRKPSRASGRHVNCPAMTKTSSNDRLTSSFLYVGPAMGQAKAQQLVAERTDLYLPGAKVLRALRYLAQVGTATIPQLSQQTGCSTTALQNGFGRLVELHQLAVSRGRPRQYRLTGKPIPML